MKLYELKMKKKKVRVSDLIMDRHAMFMAVDRIGGGHDMPDVPQFSTIPAIHALWVEDEKKYYVLHGHNVIVNAILRHEELVMMNADLEPDMRQILNVAPMDKRFMYVDKMTYKGLEDLADPDILDALKKMVV